MVDRVIVYPSAIPQDTDLLNTNKNVMVAFGYLMQAILGTSTFVDGLACTPTIPASMSVLVGGGSIYSLEQIDATAYGSLAADTSDQIVKQGIVIGDTTFNCPAPATAGQSVVYLVQASYQETDGGSTVLPYYNASNPSQPYSGPNNSGSANYTVRQGVCKLSLKTGVAAATGSQVTPTPDAGYVGLYAITVANGQVTITSSDIAQLSTAPFISPKLPAIAAYIQGGGASYAEDSSASANTINIALDPAPAALTAGMRVWIKVANTNTGAVVINTNGLGNVSATLRNGGATTPGLLQANGIYPFVYDGSHWQIESPGARQALTANTTFYVATTGSDSNSGTAAAPWQTIQHAINYIANYVDLSGYTATISVADGTYTAGGAANGAFVGGGSVAVTGNTATPGNCVISVTNGNCFTAMNGAILNIGGFKVKTVTSGTAIIAQSGGQINLTGAMQFDATPTGYAHLYANQAGAINIQTNYTINNVTFGIHWWTESGGVIINDSTHTITLTGATAFSIFAQSDSLGVQTVANVTFSGSGTGQRYSIGSNAVINTNGGGASYLPGNVAGGTSTGGVYV